jgi:hypothetical protein
MKFIFYVLKYFFICFIIKGIEVFYKYLSKIEYISINKNYVNNLNFNYLLIFYL